LRVDPRFVFIPNQRMTAKPNAPPWLYADNLLILVCFLDPGQRSFAAFAKRCSLLAGPLEQERMSDHGRKQTKPAVFRVIAPLLRCNFAQAPKHA